MTTLHSHKPKERFDVISKILLITVVALNIIGIVLLYSAEGGSFDHLAKKQLYTFIFSLSLMLVARVISVKFFYQFSYYIYFFFLIILIIADFAGYNAMGAQRWVRLGIINIQPAEFMKIGIILALSRYFYDLHSNNISASVSFLFLPIVMVAIPVFFIIRQPNLGTSVISVMIVTAMFFAAGVRIRNFVFVILSTLISLPLIWKFMHQYQKKRVLTFLSPESDPLGSGYNIIQSKIAIGSGGVSGKGLLNGSQNQLSFLPENHTDFIFTVLCEELGFVGSLFVLILYFIVIMMCYMLAANCINQFSRLVIVGCVSMLFCHIFINIGMISGILPVVGTPLPFLSYGGSNLTVSMLSLGLVLNSALYRKVTLLRIT